MNKLNLKIGSDTLDVETDTAPPFDDTIAKIVGTWAGALKPANPDSQQLATALSGLTGTVKHDNDSVEETVRTHSDQDPQSETHPASPSPIITT